MSSQDRRSVRFLNTYTVLYSIKDRRQKTLLGPDRCSGPGSYKQQARLATTAG
jgi:hypothetical protein